MTAPDTDPAIEAAALSDELIAAGRAYEASAGYSPHPDDLGAALAAAEPHWREQTAQAIEALPGPGPIQDLSHQVFTQACREAAAIVRNGQPAAPTCQCYGIVGMPEHRYAPWCPIHQPAAPGPVSDLDRHVIFLYGQGSADGWACRTPGCLWEGDVRLSRTDAQSAHDAARRAGGER